MMSAVFSTLLRSLVLLGFCLANVANAGSQCISGSHTGFTPEEVCAKWNGTNGATIITGSVPQGTSASGSCQALQTLGANFQVTTTVGGYQCTCTSIGQYDFIKNFSVTLTSDGFIPSGSVPQTQCSTDRCMGNFAGGYTSGFNPGAASCDMTGANASGTCTASYKNNGTTCGFIEPPPPCPLPMTMVNGVCSIPACPSGQVRITTNAACTPIVCTAPLVKVGDRCVIPECPLGQTYTYQNGSGSCVKDSPICVLPKTLVNNICVTPSCPAGTILDANTGSCIPNPLTNPNTTSGSPTGTATGSGTGTGTGTGGGSTGTSGGGGSPTPINNPDGTTTTGTTNTTTRGTSGAATNTSGAGTCTTAPCGSCDPTKETCGNTFGGSCKSDFKCNGDAVQCAVALATNKSECATKSLRVDEEKDTAFFEGKAAFDAGTSALGSTNGLKVTNGGNLALDQSNPYGSGGMTDVPLFNYKGTAYVLPLGQYNTQLAMLGNFLVGLALLMAVFIVTKKD